MHNIFTTPISVMLVNKPPFQNFLFPEEYRAIEHARTHARIHTRTIYIIYTNVYIGMCTYLLILHALGYIASD